MDNQNSGQAMPPTGPQAQNASRLNKGLIIGLSAGVVILLAAVVYLLMSKPANAPEAANDRQDQNQQPTTANENRQANTQDELTGWKIYKNGEYDFELQYPGDWDAPTLNDSTSSNGQPAVNLSFLNEQVQMVNDTTFISSGSLNVNISAFIADPKYKNINWEQEFLVSNGKAFYYVNTGSKVGPSPTVYVVGPSRVWLISSDDINKKGTLIKIASTFKFTDQAETSDWKTYRNEEYGFEITLSEAFQGYLVTKRIQDYDGTDYFEFKIPSVGISPQVDVDVFSIQTYPLALWNSITKDPESIPPGVELGRNSKFLFLAQLGQDPAGLPASLLRLGEGSEMWQILSTFKFIN